MSYPGSKDGNGVWQFLINNTPYHTRYFELFAGRACLYYRKRPALFSLLNDVDPVVVEHHAQHAPNDTIVTHCPAGDLLASVNWQPHDFVYLDPPYPQNARRSGATIYRHEMLTVEEHEALLQALLPLPCYIMISTKQNALYDRYLKPWRKLKFRTADHVGPVEEIIYCNYPQPALLHQYDFYGNNFTHRQGMKRKRERFAEKIMKLPAYERHLFIQELLNRDANEVKHFLHLHSQK